MKEYLVIFESDIDEPKWFGGGDPMTPPPQIPLRRAEI